MVMMTVHLKCAQNLHIHMLMSQEVGGGVGGWTYKNKELKLRCTSSVTREKCQV